MGNELCGFLSVRRIACACSGSLAGVRTKAGDVASRVAASKFRAVLSLSIVFVLRPPGDVLIVNPVGVGGTGIEADVGVASVELDCCGREYEFSRDGTGVDAMTAISACKVNCVGWRTVVKILIFFSVLKSFSSFSFLASEVRETSLLSLPTVCPCDTVDCPPPMPRSGATSFSLGKGTNGDGVSDSLWL